MLGVRVLGGIDRSAFERVFPGALGARSAELGSLVDSGLLEDDPERLRLSERGLFLANEVGSRLL